MAASLLSESAGDEPTASVGVGAGLAIVRPVMPWKGRSNSKILLKWAKSIAQMANCPQFLEETKKERKEEKRKKVESKEEEKRILRNKKRTEEDV